MTALALDLICDDQKEVLIGHLRFRLLHACPVEYVADRVQCPSIMDRMTANGYASMREYLHACAAADLNGSSLTLVVWDADRPVGVARLKRRGDQGMETATWLHHDYQGRGINAICKTVQWHLASAMGMPLFASVFVGNHRSIAAMRKRWPGVQPAVREERTPHGKPKLMLVWTMRQAPAGGSDLTEAQRLGLDLMLASEPVMLLATNVTLDETTAL